MRYLSVKILLHISLLVLTLVPVEYYLRKVDASKYYKYSYSELFNIKKADSIIIGASHATHGINPKFISSDKFYNFALNGANPSFTLTWYKELLLKNRSPKLIIYEVNWFMFDSKWLGRRIEQDSRYLPNDAIIDLLKNNNINKSQLLKNLFIVSNGGMLYKKILQPSKTKVDDSTRYNGFVALNYSELKEHDGPKYEYDSKQLNDLITFIHLMKENKSQLIFVQAPEYIPGRDSSNIINQNMLLEDIALTYQIPFLNYNGDRVSKLNYKKDLYADWGHLNNEGSIQFSKLLDGDLKTILAK